MNTFILKLRNGARRGLYCLQRLAVKDKQKLFEADYASLSMESAATLRFKCVVMTRCQSSSDLCWRS
jgi:hypothetical protein